MALAWLLGVVPLVLGAVYVGLEWGESCEKPLREYVLVAAVCFLVNLVFAVYLFRRVSLQDPRSVSEAVSARATGRNGR